MSAKTVKNEVPIDMLRQCLSQDDQGVTMVLKVKPNASKERFYMNDRREITLMVRAAAVENAANLRVIELIAETFLVAKSKIDIISGHRGRIKRILIRQYTIQDLLGG